MAVPPNQSLKKDTLVAAPLWGSFQRSATPIAIQAALHLLRLGTALGRLQSLRSPWRDGFALDGAALFGPGSNRRGRGSRRRPDFAESGSHLRSVVEVTGYRVHAVDGEIGHIENLMIDDANWSIRYLIVDTRNWWFGKRVLISPHAVKAIDWFDRSAPQALWVARIMGLAPES